MTAVVETRALARADEQQEWSIERIVEQKKKIQQCMSAVMKSGEHYGVIPGTGNRKDAAGKTLPPKPTLLKPGAETLSVMFRLKPEYTILDAIQTPTRISYRVKCLLRHIPTGYEIAEGLGSCNSGEAKYVRPAPKKCPSCDKESIIKGKEEFGGGWLCWKKKDGCGAKFPDGDEAIEKQPSGVADPADLDNTILKMACKRSHVAAVLGGTAASDFFTQDLEDLVDKSAAYETAPAVEYTPPKGRAAPVNGPAPTSGRRQPDEPTHGTPDEPHVERDPDADFEAAQRAELDEDRDRLEKLEASVMVDVLDPKTGEVIGREPKASRQQIALAHVLKDWLHVSDDVWRKRLMKRTGYDSTAKLCVRVLSELIDDMQKKKAQREQRFKEADDDLAANIVARASGIPTAADIEEENRRAAAPMPGEGP